MWTYIAIRGETRGRNGGNAGTNMSELNSSPYYNITAGTMQQKGKQQDLFIALTKDCMNIANAYGIKLPTDIMDINLNILQAVTPDTTASMQKDLAKNHQSEIDGLIFEIVCMAKAKNIAVPAYEKVASHFDFKI